MDGLEDFLSAEQPAETQAAEPAPEAPVEAPPAAEAPTEAIETPTDTVERPRGPDGKFIAKGETPVTPEPAPQEPTLDHAALIGERRRRQEAEDRIRLLEQQLQQPQAQQPAAPQGPPDQFEDPEGYTNWLVGRASEAARNEAYQAFQYQRIQMSAEEAKAKLPDYAEKLSVFEHMAAANPQLMQELYRAPNPAEYAYNTAKTQLEISQYGGIDGLIAARVQEALKTAPQPAPTPIPDTLADAQSARGTTAEGLTVPTLDDILKR